MTKQTKPRVSRTPSGLWSWSCGCHTSGMLGLHDQPGTYLEALDHSRQFHGHSTFEYGGGEWWLYRCKICKHSNFHFSLARVLDKADEHYLTKHAHQHELTGVR